MLASIPMILITFFAVLIIFAATSQGNRVRLARGDGSRPPPCKTKDIQKLIRLLAEFLQAQRLRRSAPSAMTPSGGTTTIAAIRHQCRIRCAGNRSAGSSCGGRGGERRRSGRHAEHPEQDQVARLAQRRFSPRRQQAGATHRQLRRPKERPSTKSSTACSRTRCAAPSPAR